MRFSTGTHRSKISVVRPKWSRSSTSWPPQRIWSLSNKQWDPTVDGCRGFASPLFTVNETMTLSGSSHSVADERDHLIVETPPGLAVAMLERIVAFRRDFTYEACGCNPRRMLGSNFFSFPLRSVTISIYTTECYAMIGRRFRCWDIVEGTG